MIDNIKHIGGSSVCTVLAAIQDNVVMQWIETILAITVWVLTIISIVMKWYKEAKKDGKITSDELDDLVKRVNDLDDKNEKD